MMAKYGFKIAPATFTQDLMMPEDKLTYVISDKAHEVLQEINPAVTGLTMTHSDNSISDC
jgi:Fe-S cluster assembly iron-binding protein IscA